MHCNAITVLKIDFVYKQSKNYLPQVYFKGVNTQMQKASTKACWAIQMMMC